MIAKTFGSGVTTIVVKPCRPLSDEDEPKTPDNNENTAKNTEDAIYTSNALAPVDIESKFVKIVPGKDVKRFRPHIPPILPAVNVTKDPDEEWLETLEEMQEEEKWRKMLQARVDQNSPNVASESVCVSPSWDGISTSDKSEGKPQYQFKSERRRRAKAEKKKKKADKKAEKLYKKILDSERNERKKDLKKKKKEDRKKEKDIEKAKKKENKGKVEKVEKVKKVKKVEKKVKVRLDDDQHVENKQKISKKEKKGEKKDAENRKKEAVRLNKLMSQGIKDLLKKQDKLVKKLAKEKKKLSNAEWVKLATGYVDEFDMISTRLERLGYKGKVLVVDLPGSDEHLFDKPRVSKSKQKAIEQLETSDDICDDLNFKQHSRMSFSDSNTTESLESKDDNLPSCQVSNSSPPQMEVQSSSNLPKAKENKDKMVTQLKNKLKSWQHKRVLKKEQNVAEKLQKQALGLNDENIKIITPKDTNNIDKTVQEHEEPGDVEMQVNSVNKVDKSQVVTQWLHGSDFNCLDEDLVQESENQENLVAEFEAQKNNSETTLISEKSGAGSYDAEKELQKILAQDRSKQTRKVVIPESQAKIEKQTEIAEDIETQPPKLNGNIFSINIEKQNNSKKKEKKTSKNRPESALLHQFKDTAKNNSQDKANLENENSSVVLHSVKEEPITVDDPTYIYKNKKKNEKSSVVLHSVKKEPVTVGDPAHKNKEKKKNEKSSVVLHSVKKEPVTVDDPTYIYKNKKKNEKSSVVLHSVKKEPVTVDDPTHKNKEKKKNEKSSVVLHSVKKESVTVDDPTHKNKEKKKNEKSSVALHSIRKELFSVVDGAHKNNMEKQEKVIEIDEKEHQSRVKAIVMKRKDKNGLLPQQSTKQEKVVVDVVLSSPGSLNETDLMESDINSSDTVYSSAKELMDKFVSSHEPNNKNLTLGQRTKEDNDNETQSEDLYFEKELAKRIDGTEVLQKIDKSLEKIQTLRTRIKDSRLTTKRDKKLLEFTKKTKKIIEKETAKMTKENGKREKEIIKEDQKRIKDQHCKLIKQCKSLVATHKFRTEQNRKVLTKAIVELKKAAQPFDETDILSKIDELLKNNNSQLDPELVKNMITQSMDSSNAFTLPSIFATNKKMISTGTSKTPETLTNTLSTDNGLIAKIQSTLKPNIKTVSPDADVAISTLTDENIRTVIDMVLNTMETAKSHASDDLLLQNMLTKSPSDMHETGNALLRRIKELSVSLNTQSKSTDMLECSQELSQDQIISTKVNKVLSLSPVNLKLHTFMTNSAISAISNEVNSLYSYLGITKDDDKTLNQILQNIMVKRDYDITNKGSDGIISNNAKDYDQTDSNGPDEGAQALVTTKRRIRFGGKSKYKTQHMQDPKLNLTLVANHDKVLKYCEVLKRKMHELKIERDELLTQRNRKSEIVVAVRLDLHEENHKYENLERHTDEVKSQCESFRKKYYDLEKKHDAFVTESIQKQQRALRQFGEDILTVNTSESHLKHKIILLEGRLESKESVIQNLTSKLRKTKNVEDMIETLMEQQNLLKEQHIKNHEHDMRQYEQKQNQVELMYKHKLEEYRAKIECLPDLENFNSQACKYCSKEIQYTLDASDTESKQNRTPSAIAETPLSPENKDIQSHMHIASVVKSSAKKEEKNVEDDNVEIDTSNTRKPSPSAIVETPLSAEKKEIQSNMHITSVVESPAKKEQENVEDTNVEIDASDTREAVSSAKAETSLSPEKKEIQSNMHITSVFESSAEKENENVEDGSVQINTHKASAIAGTPLSPSPEKKGIKWDLNIASDIESSAKKDKENAQDGTEIPSSTGFKNPLVLKKENVAVKIDANDNQFTEDSQSDISFGEDNPSDISFTEDNQSDISLTEEVENLNEVNSESDSLMSERMSTAIAEIRALLKEDNVEDQTEDLSQEKETNCKEISSANVEILKEDNVDDNAKGKEKFFFTKIPSTVEEKKFEIKSNKKENKMAKKTKSFIETIKEKASLTKKRIINNQHTADILSNALPTKIEENLKEVNSKSDTSDSCQRKSLAVVDIGALPKEDSVEDHVDLSQEKETKGFTRDSSDTCKERSIGAAQIASTFEEEKFEIQSSKKAKKSARTTPSFLETIRKSASSRENRIDNKDSILLEEETVWAKRRPKSGRRGSEPVKPVQKKEVSLYAPRKYYPGIEYETVTTEEDLKRIARIAAEPIPDIFETLPYFINKRKRESVF